MLRHKWYKFLIYYVLWVMTAVNFIQGIFLIHGIHYKVLALSKSTVYNYFSDLQRLDKLFGIVFVFISVYITIVAYKLSNLKKSAPKMLIIMHVIIVFFRLLCIIIYPISLSHILNLYNGLSLFLNVAIMLFNYFYFKRFNFAFIN